MNRNPFHTDPRARLKDRIPEEALDEAAVLLASVPVHLRFSPHRKTKRGDFRPAVKAGEPHRISVNVSLNPFAFLVTYLHEMAHVLTWMEYGRRVKPHGIEWQNQFRNLLRPFLEKGVFPEELSAAVHRYTLQPKASSCSDPVLYRALSAFDPPSDSVALESLSEGSTFGFNGRVFRKGAKRRTRFECTAVPGGRTYTFHPLAEVQIIVNVAG